MDVRHLFRVSRGPGAACLVLRCCAALVGLLLLAACSSVQGLHEVRPETSMEWPVGAEGTRVAWVRTIDGFKELGSGKGFWGRALDLLTGGENERSIVRPYGVLHDASGRLYLADPGAGVVHCLDIARGRYSVIGGRQESPMRSPIGLAEDERGRLYITDSGSGVVYRHDPDDDSLKPFLVTLKRPTGIVFNPSNKLLYISDTVESQVVAVDQNGVERKRLGGPGDAANRFNRPTDLAVDGIGQIYVTDSLNFRITVLTPEGQLVRQFGDVGDARGYFSRPKGIATDSAGHVYVCDSLRDAVQVFDAEGKPLLVFGKAGSGQGRFWMPSGLYIDRSDYIFVADTYNKRVQVFRYLSGQDSVSGNESKLIGASPEPGVLN
jgi:sugar lactone lactonase YvrE